MALVASSLTSKTASSRTGHDARMRRVKSRAWAIWSGRPGKARCLGRVISVSGTADQGMPAWPDYLCCLVRAFQRPADGACNPYDCADQRSDHAGTVGQWAQLGRAGAVLSAHQEREQVVGRGVVAHQLRGDALGLQEHVDGGRIVALLSVGAAKVEADLAAAASQARR